MQTGWQTVNATSGNRLIQCNSGLVMLRIFDIWISQANHYGEEEREALKVTVSRYDASTLNGFTNVTPEPYQSDNLGTASGRTWKRNGDSMPAMSGEQVLIEDSWNIQFPWRFAPSPEHEINVTGTKQFYFGLSGFSAGRLISATIIFGVS